MKSWNCNLLMAMGSCVVALIGLILPPYLDWRKAKLKLGRNGGLGKTHWSLPHRQGTDLIYNGTKVCKCLTPPPCSLTTLISSPWLILDARSLASGKLYNGHTGVYSFQHYGVPRMCAAQCTLISLNISHNTMTTRHNSLRDWLH